MSPGALRVDPHADTIDVAVITATGCSVGDEEFPDHR